ncbi:hypothetical protein I8J29_05670 [Paenibacillus sp. MWE-103]|uniref:Glycosyl hydrolase family 10 n=1 Tax=Paenibacillus artemisiicola TaxID=1172618 RepID=A0ABS3W5U9_9BACL|nr:hypothetical protein [Paenibacillus artemisiicola]MBO7743675.1 hypothetical protein [Paenibacillus artemisiicola]
MKDYGVNARWFHLFNEAAFEACAEQELEACVEFKTFRADFQAHPELIPIGVDRKPIRYGRLVQGICLSQKEYLAKIEEELLAGIKQFKPRGIWLDYLTYAGWFETSEPDLQESCFCPDCIADFCNTAAVDAADPQEILACYSEEWKQHKCRKIADFALHYARLIKAHGPDCIVGAYMCPWTPDEFDGALTRIFAQSYHDLAEAIDVYTPLIYGSKSGRGPAWGREWLAQSAGFVPEGRKAQLILDALDYPESLEETARSEVPSWGIQVFAGASLFRDKEKAIVFRNSVETIRNLLPGDRSV